MPQGMLIDTGGLDKFLEPDTAILVRFWKNFPDAKHCITPVVYWEYLNQFGPEGHSQKRAEFMWLIEKDRLEFLDFARGDADLAVRIFHKVRVKVEGLPKSKKRERLKKLQCDIFIAATACRHRKRVFTMDREDWQFIREAIREIHELEVVFGDELIPAGKRTPSLD